MLSYCKHRLQTGVVVTLKCNNGRECIEKSTKIFIRNTRRRLVDYYYTYIYYVISFLGVKEREIVLYIMLVEKRFCSGTLQMEYSERRMEKKGKTNDSGIPIFLIKLGRARKKNTSRRRVSSSWPLVF